jgi:ABC-type multidrug transport system ATPase subunit
MSMRIELDGVAKRYRLEWVLRNVNLTFQDDKKYAVTGPNGSGKSTLMRILAGHLTPSRGQARFFYQNNRLDSGEVYRFLSYAAPYIELIEEFTLTEAIDFHKKFKSFARQMTAGDIISLLGFESSRHKPIRNFSSGMKQRLKLALAVCSETPLLLLDEPTTNLDRQGVEWYRRLIDEYAPGRLVIVASNVEVDYEFCEEVIGVEGMK